MSIHESRRTPGARPRFSVLIPTRDRPAYVRNALESVLEQSFTDFEVIVCDNYKNRSCQAEVEAFGDARVRYVKPPQPLAMHDNWEFAIDQARGDYVLVVIDKTLLRLNALEHLQAATLSHPAEVYSWTSDAYYLTHEKEGDVGRGYLVPVRAAGEPFYVDSKQEMTARLSFQDRIGSEGPSYVYGKICFGAFSRKLIDKIKTNFGKVCPLIAPDYTSKTLSLLSTDRFVDLNGSYGVHLNTQISNGMLFSQSTVYARRFLGEAGMSEAEFADLPIPHVFCSIHNICAYDWRMLERAYPGTDYRQDSLDRAAVYVQTEADLEAIEHWESEEEKLAIFGHMQAFLEAAPAEMQERVNTIRAKLAPTVPALWKAMARSHGDQMTKSEPPQSPSEFRISPREQQNKVLRTMRLAYKALRRFWRRAVSAGKSPSIGSGTQNNSAAAASPAPLVGPTVNGFPSFRSTIAALRYADSEFYSYPLPQPAPVAWTPAVSPPS